MTIRRRPLRALVIEDDAQVRRVFLRVLGLMFEDVVAVESGSVGLEALTQGDFGLVVTDLKMAGLGGLEVTRRIKNDYPELPVVITTGFASQKDREAIEAVGAALLPKPFDVDELRQLLVGTLGPEP